jgi:hypothetical protein
MKTLKSIVPEYSVALKNVSTTAAKPLVSEVKLKKNALPYKINSIVKNNKVIINLR